MSCTLSALVSLSTELQIVGELQPGDRLTVPNVGGDEDLTLEALPTIERAGMWQSVVRALRGQSRGDTVTYIASLVTRVQDQERTGSLSIPDITSLVYSIGCARTGISALRSTYGDDTRVSKLLEAQSLALNACLESLVKRKGGADSGVGNAAAAAASVRVGVMG